MNTNELIEEVRNGLVEYQTIVISDSVVLSSLNHAYRQVYNHYARADDNMFGKIHELNLTTGTRVYTLPKTLWSKRIDYMQVPTPGNQAMGYVKVMKINAKQSHQYNLPQAYSKIPWAWQQLGDEIEIFPKPQQDVTVRLIVQPRLLPLAYTEGTVLSFGTPNITCVDDLRDEFIAYGAATNSSNFLSICDGLTGQLKNVYKFTTVTGTTVTLAVPGTRTSIKGEALATPSATSDIALDDVITYGLSTGVPIIGEAFDEYLVKYAVLSIKSALNENDASFKAQLDKLEKEYLSDTCGRPSITTIERLDRNTIGSSRFRRSR